ncbi:hypothetical protein COCSUDRAFT_43406 [Coccomyxa subellipsoidea C-169]|uniref:Uncharacterized protein n=1 Tax=Coccomyxa subellipsoidea (strain C-169) TaxID=574566 RepID=I0YRM8_COCSC|nr:hypothetical protein COCSUDRAFT_43406 [Coccomyxa subellipsoidea C-169]EIE21047.1 hypothetical protein COCSUDRAFT_43406 [Coccomyxa subellipsoidea C-169]|eukprot:XP_005645591.1 hypothetical protein COCSUDRAFT_43406 [Coccomyxa subellipsoidea C-169]
MRQEKQQATERQLQELSERVAALQMERDQLERAVESATSGLQGLQQGGSSASAEAMPLDGEVAVTFCFGEASAQLQLTQGQVRALTIEAMADIWKTLVQKMRVILELVDASPAANRLRPRLEGLVHETMRFLWALVDLNPHMLRALNICNVEAPAASVAQPSLNAPRDWPVILARMQLTEGQAHQLLACRRTLLCELGVLISEWDQLWSELQSIRDVDEKPEGAVNHYVEIAALIERLRANVDALSTCRAFYLSFAYTRVLSPVQVARYLVESYPMGPDMLSLVTCLATQGNEPSTRDLLSMARPGAAATAGAGSSAAFGAGGGSATAFGGGGGSHTAFGAGGATSSAAFPAMGTSSAAFGGVAGSAAAFGSGSSSHAAFSGPGDWRQALVHPLRVLHSRSPPASSQQGHR